jgi:uncharacterized membrane-anchored protein
MTQKLPNPRFFWIAFVIQLLMMIGVPAQAIYTQLTGQSVILKTIPVDPYDPMRGYSTTLRYDISEVKLLQTLPGWKDMPTVEDVSPDYSNPKKPKQKPRILKPGSAVYVTLEQDRSAKTANTLQPWKATAISAQLPQQRSPEKVILKGVVNSSPFSSQFIDYGLETYYMPENRRDEVNAAIQGRKAVAEIKVDAQGRGVPLKLRVGNQDFEF